MKQVIILLFLLTYTVSGDTLTCADIKTTYNNKECCSNLSADTCLRSLPACTDTNVVAGQICTDVNGNAFVKGLDSAFDLSSATHIILKKSIIPDTNNAYDFGNAEYKIRDIYEHD